MQRFKPAQELQKQVLSLATTNNWRCLTALALDWIIIGGAVAMSEWAWWFYPVSAVVIAARQRALATIMHDAVHLRAARNRRLNFVYGWMLSGLWIGQDFHAYRQSHVMEHHGVFGDAENDPDYRNYLVNGLYEPQSRTRFAWRFVLKPLMGGMTVAYLRYVARGRLAPLTRSRHGLYTVAAWLIILAVAGLTGHMSALVIYWMVPLLLVFPVIGWFIEIAEHFPLLGEVDNELYVTRNRNSHWLEHEIFGIHNESYHLTHHLFASIPFWNIKRAHQILMADPRYRDWHNSSGGIFLSGNGRPTLVARLLRYGNEVRGRDFEEVEKTGPSERSRA